MSELETKRDEVLERNVEQLLTRAHEPPRISDEARARILANLKAERRARAAEGHSEQASGLWGWLRARPALITGLAVAATVALVFSAARHFAGLHEGGTLTNATPQPKRMVLADGSELILNRDTEVEVLGHRHIRVTHGELLLDVAKDRERFTVESPHGRVVVLGTRFLVSASDVETVAAVLRGRVRIENQRGAETLRPGEQGVLRDGQLPVRRAAPRLSHLTSWAKLARRQEEGRETAPARRGTLLARNPNWQENEFPLPMRALTVDVHVENQVARVALDQTFFNTQQQQLEGVYRFALPPGASISRQAMYVDGKLMESAIVERQRGRHIYEEIVYRRRDPALMEWMAGNLFKVRIFPLPPRTEKRILVSYTQSLERLYDDYRLEVPIPEVDGRVGTVRYNVRLVGCADCTVSSTSHEISVAREGNDALVTFAADNYQIGDDFLLTVRDPVREPRVAAHRAGGNRYYLARVDPDLRAAWNDAEASTPEHRRWVILHDTSASRSALERKAQAYLIDHLLREMDEDDEVNLLAFDTTVRQMSPEFERVGEVGRRSVAAFLRDQSADGVGYTDLEKVLDRATALLGEHSGDGFAPHILYLGDGIVTGGERGLGALRAAVRGKATFIGIGVGERVDANVLRELAWTTGGYFATMNPGDDLAWRAFDLIAALNTPRVVDLGATLLDGEGKPLGDAVAYASSRQLSDGEELSVVARLGDAIPAAVELHGSLAGSPWSQRIALPAPAGGPKSGGYLPRLWAQRRVEALIGDDAEEHKKEITDLGVRNFLVTPYTSLLVLENDHMYDVYKVKRDRKPGWAAYPAPKKIEVVSEPLGSEQIPANVAPDAVMVRTPVQAVQTQAGMGWDANLDELLVTESGFDNGLVLGTRGMGSGGGAVVTASLSRASDSSGVLSVLGAGQHEIELTTLPVGATVTANRETAAEAFDEDREAEEKAGKGDLAQVVTTEDLTVRHHSWSGHVDFHGEAKKSKRASGPTKPDAFVAVDGKMGGLSAASAYQSVLGGRDKAAERRRGRMSGNAYTRSGRYYYYGYYGNAPAPVAYHWAYDVRLDDLTEFVPAFLVDGFDVQLETLRKAVGTRRGSITDAARALIDRAQAARRPTRYRTEDGQILSVDAAGRFRLEHKLDTGLVETIAFTGDRLYKLYPELDLAVRRDAEHAAPLLYAQLAPYLLPDADSLARWYYVSLSAPRTLRIGMSTDPDAPVVEIALDRELRVAEMRTVHGGERSVDLTVDYRPSELVVTVGTAQATLRVEPVDEVPPTVDESQWTVAEMPLRQPGYWSDKAKAETAGTPEWRYAQRQLLASYAALGNGDQLWKVLGELAEADGPLSRGELALGSRAARWTSDNKQRRRVLDGMDADDPVRAYFLASQKLAHDYRSGALDAVAERSEGSLIGMLASYRGLLGSLYYDANHKAAKRRFKAFLDEYQPLALRYIAAYQMSSQWGWRAPEETAEMWDLFAEKAGSEGPWRAIADYQAARVLYNGRKFDEATDRFEKLLGQQQDAGQLPPLDQTVAWAFRQSSRGEAGWRLFWNRWRERALESDDASVLMGLLRSAQACGMSGDIDRIVARLSQVEIPDPDTAVMLADLLNQNGRADRALAVLAPWLGKNENADAGVMQRASYIAEQHGRYAEAIDYLERAMEIYYEDAAELSVIRSDYQRLINLYGRRAQVVSGTKRAELLHKALAAAAEWRKVDPDNSQIDSITANTLYSLGRPEEAWRYLSTAIERHPMEGSAYQVVADALEAEGRVDQAEPMWRRAYEVEPTNPTWLLRRSQALFALGERDTARELLQEIAKKEWHERFFNVKYQAEQLARRQAR